MKSALARDKVWVLITLIVMIAPAYAAVQVNERTEIALTVFIPCAANGAGEIVDLAGPLHTLISFTISGNNVRGYTHFQPQGIVGIGETTGVKYRAIGITQESFKNSFRNGQANDTFVNNFRIIGQGPGNNFLVHETEHLTIDVDGSLTVSHDNFSVVCK